MDSVQKKNDYWRGSNRKLILEEISTLSQLYYCQCKCCTAGQNFNTIL